MHQTVSFFFFTFDFKLNGFLKVSIFFSYILSLSLVSLIMFSIVIQIFFSFVGLNLEPCKILWY